MTRNFITSLISATAVFFVFTHINAFSEDGVLLQGEVKKEEVATLTQLHEVGIAEEKVKRVSEDLYQESTRPQITTEEEPDLIGTTIIELPVPVQTGYLLPPRSKWINRFMDELDKLVPMLKEEVGEIVIPDIPNATHDKDTQLYNSLVSDISVIEQRFNSLKQLCGSTPYDQAAIANASAVIHLAVKNMETSRKQLYELIRKPSS